MSPQPRSSGSRQLRYLPLFLALLATSCVGGEAPTDPSDVLLSPTAQLAVAPRFAGASGEALSTAAAQEAFDQLTCFELVAVRLSNGEEVARETFEVTPGQDSYELSVEVQLEQPSEQFLVTITAYASAGGDSCGFELFSGTSEVTAEAEGLGGGDGGGGAAPATLTLTPSGPQAQASELVVEQGHAVLSGGGTVQLVPTLLDDAGAVLADGAELAEVLEWTSSSPGTAEVDAAGTVTGGSDGAAEITAGTVTGLTATVPVYVATGEFAYVSGGGLIRTAVDGQGMETVASGASRPAWRPDGGGLAYESGGSIVEAGGGTLLSGAGSPAFSPDGAHVAGASGGTLAFATADGAFQTEEAGPAGTSPQWLDAATLVVDGGSIERVRADGSERTALAGHSSDRLPAVGGGRIAFLSSRDGGSTGVFVMDTGGGEPTRVTPDEFTASGRPAIRGGWILVAGSGELGSGLHLVPADGSGAPLPLSIEGGGDPAWRPSGGGSPASLSLSGTDPARPLGGQEVTLVGGGFDWIVPEANTVEVPVLSGAASAAGRAGIAVPGDATVEVEVLEVTESGVTFVAPSNLAAGTLTARTAFSEASLELTPASGDVKVVAETAGGKLVDGIEVEVLGGSGKSLTSATTDAGGTVTFEDLTVGDYTLAVTSREGFVTTAEIGPVTVSLDETTTVALDVVALPWTVEASKSSIKFQKVGLEEEVEVTVKDVDGDVIDAALQTGASSPAVVSVLVTGPSTVKIKGKVPGTSDVTIGAEPTSTSGSATSAEPASTSTSADAAPEATISVEVLGAVSGRVEYRYEEPDLGLPGAAVKLSENGKMVASTKTNGNGEFEFAGLSAGKYGVELVPPDHFEIEGEAAKTALLGGGDPTPHVTFTVDPDPHTVQVHPAELALAPGQKETVEAVVRDAINKLIPFPDDEGEEVVWSSSDPDIVTVVGSSPTATVTAVGVGEATVTATSADASGTATVKIEIEIGFADGFEDDSGWETSGLWNRTTGSGITNTDHPSIAHLPPGDESGGALPTADEGTHYFWYGSPSRGNFNVGSTSGTLTSPVFAIPEGGGVLSFRTWFEIESVDENFFDLMVVRVVDAGSGELLTESVLNPSSDAGNPGSRFPFTSSGSNQPPGWKTISVDLSGLGNKAVRLVFIFNSGDSLYNYFRGWIVDDVKVFSGGGTATPFTSFAPALDGDAARTNGEGLSYEERLGQPRDAAATPPAVELEPGSPSEPPKKPENEKQE